MRALRNTTTVDSSVEPSFHGNMTLFGLLPSSASQRLPQQQAQAELGSPANLLGPPAAAVAWPSVWMDMAHAPTFLWKSSATSASGTRPGVGGALSVLQFDGLGLYDGCVVCVSGDGRVVSKSGTGDAATPPAPYIMMASLGGWAVSE